MAQLDAALRGVAPTSITPAPVSKYSSTTTARSDPRPLVIAMLLLLVVALTAAALILIEGHSGPAGTPTGPQQPTASAPHPAGSVDARASTSISPVADQRSASNAPSVSSPAAAPDGAGSGEHVQVSASGAFGAGGSSTESGGPAGAAAVGTGAPVSNGDSSDPQAVIAQVKASVVLILAEVPDGVASGTGFVVGPGEIATCAHVVDGATRIVVITADGRQIEPTIGPTDPVDDVAVLRCAAPLPPPLHLESSGAVREGDPVAVTGFPQFFDLHQLGFTPVSSTSRGYVSAKRTRATENGDVSEIQIDAPINPGNSGGPVYETRDGSVLGLAAATIRGAQGLNFASPVDALQRLLG